MTQPCGLRLVASGRRRGIAFLDFSSNRHVNINSMFQRLPKADERYFRTLFDYWTAGVALPSTKAHSWAASYKKGRFADCMVFKHARKQHRIYGFINDVHHDEDYRLCILAVFARKKENETDESILERIRDLKDAPNVRRAISDWSIEQVGRDKR